MRKFMYFVVIALFFVGGCSFSENNLLAGLATQPVALTTPRDIAGFSVMQDEEELYVRFSLVDGNGQETAADGTVVMVLMDNSEMVLYRGEFNVVADDFRSYYFKTSGQKFFAYLWSIPLLEVEKSSSVFGKAQLSFITKEGEKFESANDYVVVPSYDEDELERLNEEMYGKSAVEVDVIDNLDGLELLITKAGRFSPLVRYGKSGPYLRIDLEVTNKGKGDDSLYTPNAILMDQMGNEYLAEYGGTFDGKAIPLGERRTGYILFSGVPEENSKVVILRLEHGYDEKLKPKIYEYRIALG